MTREERAAWLEEWADECRRKGDHSIRDGDTRLAEFWQKRGAFLRRLAAKQREPDGEVFLHGLAAKYREPDGEIMYHIGNTRPALMPNDSGGDPVIYLDSLEADNED